MNPVQAEGDEAAHSTRARGAARAMLCLGDPLVDLICERHVEGLGEADAFVPHFGGVVANVAVVAARAGAAVSMAGRAGDDAWGGWLAHRLERERVDTSLFRLVPGEQTPVAFVTVEADGEPTYTIYGAPRPAAAGQLDPEALEAALEEASGLFLSSNTLVEEADRAATMRVRQAALDRGRPVVFDPNLRLHRWRSRADAAASANACVPGALLVRANALEAELMTGEADPERAALALLKAGARAVVISLGWRGAMLRGEMKADAQAPELGPPQPPPEPNRQEPGPRPLLSTLGAGDVLTGLLVARLVHSGFYLPAVAAGLQEAVERAAQACTRWGALE